MRVTFFWQGGMRLVRGAFSQGIIPHNTKYKDETSTHHDWDADETCYDKAQEVPVRVPKGAVLCWHGAALHTSRANTSERWRRAYAVHFVSEDATQGADRSPVLASCHRYGEVPGTGLGAKL